jgi:hypothetical protein
MEAEVKALKTVVAHFSELQKAKPANQGAHHPHPASAAAAALHSPRSPDEVDQLVFEEFAAWHAKPTMNEFVVCSGVFFTSPVAQ